MNAKNLIPHSHAARMQRAADKRRRLLAFLRSEVWTTPPVAAQVMQLKQLASAVRPLASMQKDGLIVLERVARPGAGNIDLIGITLDGQAQIAHQLGKPFQGKAYERGRVGLTTLDHRCDLQRLRLACAKVGWRDWQYPDRVDAVTKTKNMPGESHRPDAIAVHPSDVHVAIEVERTIKSMKRYRFIVGRHLEAIARGDYAKVIYTSPDISRAEALRSIMQNLGHVVCNGRDVPTVGDLFNPFQFCTYTELPNLEMNHG